MQSPQHKCLWVQIIAFQCRETTLTKRVYPRFNFCVFCLPSKRTSQKFPTVRHKKQIIFTTILPPPSSVPLVLIVVPRIYDDPAHTDQHADVLMWFTGPQN